MKTIPIKSSNKKKVIKPWRRGKKFSKAKTYLKLLLKSDDDNWVKQIIAEDPKVSSTTIDKNDKYALFQQEYKKENFRANFWNLKKAIDKNAAAVLFDQQAFDKESTNYPKEVLLKAGYPQWKYIQNDARKLLENDMKEGGLYSSNTDMKPNELHALRPEYQKFLSRSSDIAYSENIENKQTH